MNDFIQQFSDAPWGHYLLVIGVAAAVLFGGYGILIVRDMLSHRESDEDKDHDLNFYRPEEEPVKLPAFRFLACGQEVPAHCVIAANDKGVPHGLDS